MGDHGWKPVLRKGDEENDRQENRLLAKRMLGTVGLIAVLILIAAQVPEMYRDAREQIRPTVTLLHYEVIVDKRHVASVVSIILQNSSRRAAKDFQVTCSALAASGTRLGDIESTVFQRIEAKSSLALEGPVELGTVHPQAATFECHATGAKFAD